jgi:thiamine biosynthesis lipoprotein
MPTAPASARSDQAQAHAFKAMGSPCEILMFAPERGDEIAALARAEVERLEARYTRYRPTSFLSEINRAAAGGGSIEVDAETALLLDYAAACFEQSGGLFDITSGVLRQAWRFDRGELPDRAVLDELTPRIGWDKVSWRSPVLSFPVPGMEIDFGGVVKEYAVDRVAGLLEGAGVRHGAVNLGGDVRIVGPRPDGAAWSVGIRHHRRPGAVAGAVELKRGAMATSGDYERCIVIDGAHYGHILNPRTGWPVRGLASVSVVAELCLLAGSAATIAMLKEDEGPAWLASLGLDHLWIDLEGRRGGTI